jgi:hypothetical protein
MMMRTHLKQFSMNEMLEDALAVIGGEGDNIVLGSEVKLVTHKSLATFAEPTAICVHFLLDYDVDVFSGIPS